MGARRARRGPSWGTAALGLVVALTLAGCTATPDAAPGAAGDDPGTTLAREDGDGADHDDRPEDRWTADALPVHTQLSATDDSIVYGGVADEDLVVTALDPATGAERWRHPSVVSDRIRGVEQTILTDDDTAYFLTDEGGLALTAITTATGEVRWSTELAGEADANARSCDPDVCVFVAAPAGRELWRFDRASGAVIGRSGAAAPEGADDGVVVATGRDDLRYLKVTWRPYEISQRSEDGAVTDWTQPVASLFPGVEVSTGGGWAGWSTDDGGWVLWLGSPRDAGPVEEGEVVATGHVAGFGPEGSATWLREERHPCQFAMTTVPVLCDGELVGTSDETGSMTPTVMEGIDELTGETTWSLALEATIDELDSADSVLRVDDRTSVIEAPGGLVRVDLETGPSPTDDADAIGWCSAVRGVHDRIDDGDAVAEFVRSSGEYPCRLGGDPVDEPAQLPVPDFAGVTAAGWSAWVVDAAVHAQRVP